MYSYYQKYLIIIIIINYNVIFSNFIFKDYSIKNIRKYEIDSILNDRISTELYYFTNIPIQSSSRDVSIDLLKNIKNLTFNPVLGLRYSSSGFSINPIGTPGSSIWISPGAQFNYITPIISVYSGYLFQVWGSFYKHSAYFLNESKLNKSLLESQNLKPYEYNPYLSMEYYVQTEEPSWGVDFDEAQGGIGVLSENLEIFFGKFKSSLGPFHRGNLSLSLRSPSFPQIKINYRKKNNNKTIFDFTYFIGDLISEIADSSVLNAYINEDFDNFSKLPWINRKIIHHRIDLHFSNNFRIGFYEQIIFGARQVPWQYLIPVNLYWSAQHAIGDFDNLQMGFDIDWIHNSGRSNLAFLMDEWAPFKTFNSMNHHNWFAIQFGHSQIVNLFNQRLYFRFENTLISPQIYEHKFPINQVFNQGYPLGYWTKGDAVDFWLTLTLLNKNKFSPRVEFDYTIFGEPKYGVSRRFLKNKNSNRSKFNLVFEYQFNGYTKCEFNISYFKNKNFEDNLDDYFGFLVSYKYNITY
tara:strand:- start:284 stop:1849 length:1566 start_codon:yes stop_codon:yes gene_type:complete